MSNTNPVDPVSKGIKTNATSANLVSGVSNDINPTTNRASSNSQITANKALAADVFCNASAVGNATSSSPINGGFKI
jgi:hypothetical protein